MALNAYIRREEWSQINDLSFQVKKLEKEEHFRIKPKKGSNKDQNRNQWTRKQKNNKEND